MVVVRASDRHVSCLMLTSTEYLEYGLRRKCLGWYCSISFLKLGFYHVILMLMPMIRSGSERIEKAITR